jgi:hypothetical protein
VSTTRFVVTSIVRRAAEAHTSGFARVLSREDGRVVACAAVPESLHRAADQNPRGGLRGARGVSAWGDRLVIANTERLFVLGRDWRIQRDITHPWMGGVHGLLAEEDGIWVTCTMADLLIKVDWEGRLIHDWEWRRDDALLAAFGYDRLPPVDRDVDYREPGTSRTGVRNVAHINGVSRDPDGRLVVSFGRVLAPAVYRRQAVARMAGRLAQVAGVTWRPTSDGRKPSPTVPSGSIEGSTFAVVALDGAERSEILLTETGTRVPNHDVEVNDGLLVYCDTNRARLVGVDMETGLARCAVAIPGEPSFVRGLEPLGGLRFLVGSQRPAAVHEVDLGAEAITATHALGGDPDESVYDIALVPEGFADPTGPFFASR